MQLAVGVILALDKEVDDDLLGRRTRQAGDDAVGARGAELAKEAL
tara:strand:- start:694 stop:828 length:135 start_codon:yes stop_codon:yes gene_type:complete